MQLQRILGELSQKSWRKIGGSVYLVNIEYSESILEMLKSFVSRLKMVSKVRF